MLVDRGASPNLSIGLGGIDCLDQHLEAYTIDSHITGNHGLLRPFPVYIVVIIPAHTAISDMPMCMTGFSLTVGYSSPLSG
jgi:hypothetical protein